MKIEEIYKEKFHEEFNNIMKLEGIGTYDIYDFCKTFFRLKQLEEEQINSLKVGMEVELQNGFRVNIIKISGNYIEVETPYKKTFTRNTFIGCKIIKNEKIR